MGNFFSTTCTAEQEQIVYTETKLESIFSSSGKKRALVIGINYNEDEYKDDDLNGCVNDMNNLSQFLKKKCYFLEDDICILENSDATRENIQEALLDLVVFSCNNPGSEIWLSYSGHGSNVFSFEEDDMKSEVICPSDYATKGVISDEWIQDRFVMGLEKSTKVFALMDCCNSGSNLNLPYRYKELSTVNHDANKHSSYILSDLENICNIIKISGCEDDQTSADYYERSANEFQGALTNAFINFQNTDTDILCYYQNMMSYLKNRGFTQKPVLSFTKVGLMKNEIRS